MSTFFKDPVYYRQRLTEIAGLQEEYAFTVKKEDDSFIINSNSNYFDHAPFPIHNRSDWRDSYKAVVTFSESGLKLDVTINKITLVFWLFPFFILICFLLITDSSLLLLLLFQLGVVVLIYRLKRRYRKRVTDFLNNI